MNVFAINKFLLIRNLAVLCMVGNMLYFLFPFPAIVWRLSFVLLSLWCVCENGLRFGFTRFERAILVFVSMNLIYFFASYLWLTPSTTQIGNTLYALLAFTTFVFLGKIGVLTEKFITTIAILFVIVAVPAFYNAQQIALSKLLSGGEETTTNMSVLFLMLLPFIFLIKNRILSLGVFCICLFFLLEGAKRGNIVAAVIPSMLYVWMLFKENRRSFFKMSLLVIAIMGIFVWAKDLVLGDDYLLQRYEDTLEGNTSGRSVIYATLWNLWANSDSLIRYLLGYGYDGTITYSDIHKYAHNDWLEILVDFGLVGIISYMYIFICIIRYVSIKKLDACYYYAYISIISIWLLKTLYSMAFTDQYLALMSIPFGFLLAIVFLCKCKSNENSICCS